MSAFNNMIMHPHLFNSAIAQPQAQQQENFYSGQWTKEEQDYVAVLVEGFKEGSLDIPDGTSLRFFIAAKLGCKPKRVSKKYERTGYNGKFTFRKDSRFSEEELDQKRKNLQNLEKLFRESRKLVAKMQDAKGGGKKQVSPGATINFSSNYGDLPAMQSMDQHLALLRLQISGGGGRGLMPPSSSAAFGGLRAASTSRADLLQAMIMSRNGWSPYSPMMMGLRPAAGEGILQELAQRRQQLLRSNTVMAGMANPMMPFPSSAYGTGCGNASSLLSGPTKTHERRHLGKVDGEATPAQPACETLKRGLGALTSAAAIASPVDERKKEVSNAKRPHIS